MLLFLSLVVAFVVIVFLFMQQAKFGRKPTGVRLEKIKQSPHYKNGSFQNQHFTPDFTEGATFYSVLKDFLFKRSKQGKPSQKIPSFKTDLLALGPDEDVLIWMGHSSYFLQVDGKKILVDPVLSGNASPISSGTKAFNGADIYKAADIPEIDFLFISHDHWDHLDYKLMLQLKPKVKLIITGLGTGEHFECWGFNNNMVIEKDWNEAVQLEDGFTVTVTPSRHFSGRSFTRNKALWVSFVLQTPNKKIYLGGDSGYDSHFKEIGKQHGPFDLAVLECGQYNKSWKHIHMMPEETVAAAIDLQAKKLLAVHWGKFMLSLHSWKDPAERASIAAKEKAIPLFTPMIGEKFNLNETANSFSFWWEKIN